MPREDVYEPGGYIARVGPTPLLLIVTEHDDVAFTDLQLDAYERAREPKKLVLLPGDHFAPYDETFHDAVTPTVEWFLAHLACDAGCGTVPREAAVRTGLTAGPPVVTGASTPRRRTPHLAVRVSRPRVRPGTGVLAGLPACGSRNPGTTGAPRIQRARVTCVMVPHIGRGCVVMRA